MSQSALVSFTIPALDSRDYSQFVDDAENLSDALVIWHIRECYSLPIVVSEVERIDPPTVDLSKVAPNTTCIFCGCSNYPEPCDCPDLHDHYSDTRNEWVPCGTGEFAVCPASCSCMYVDENLMVCEDHK
jgi:hypothetical protein